MQTISSILKIERGQGTWVDDVGSSTYTPSFPLGVLVTLAIDLRAPLADGAELPSLPAYPKSELEGLSLLFVMDLDYDQETIPPFIRTTGITLTEDAAGHLICSIPLPDTNTEAMRNALSTAETQTFRCEIIGRNSSGFDVFAVPFSMTVRNRVLLGDATETPDTSAADWIPTVDAMLQEIVAQKAESLKGASGADGSDGQSAYDLWIAQGNSGTEAEFLASLKGDTGDKGDKGDTGDTGSLTMGTVTTLESGEDATATITDGVLSLGIPTGPRGTDGFALCYAFSPVSDADSDQWHQSVQEEDIYWRISEDNGATWSAARRLEQAAVAPIARFSAVAQTTDSVWVTPTQMDEYVQLPAGAAYFRIQCKGYPWTEPRLISATAGTDGMTADEIAAAEATLKAASIRAQFSADGAEWHAAITSGDLYVRFFSTTGTVLAKWSLVSYGVEHSIQDLQVSEAGAPWHDTPQDGDRYMKISLDGGATWYAKCFQIQGEKGEKGDPGDGYTLPTASASTLGGVKVGTGLAVSEDGTLSSTSTGEAYTLPTASASTLGGVKVGTGLSVSSDGTLSSTGEAYTLPTASASTLGGVKVGTGLSVSEDGTLSATATSGSGTTVDSDTIAIIRSQSDFDKVIAKCDATENKRYFFMPEGDITLTYPNGSEITILGTLVYSVIKAVWDFSIAAKKEYVLTWRMWWEGVCVWTRCEKCQWTYTADDGTQTPLYLWFNLWSDPTHADETTRYTKGLVFYGNIDGSTATDPLTIPDGEYPVAGNSSLQFKVVKSGRTFTWYKVNPYSTNDTEYPELASKLSDFKMVVADSVLVTDPMPEFGLRLEEYYTEPTENIVINYFIVPWSYIWKQMYRAVLNDKSGTIFTVIPGSDNTFVLTGDATLDIDPLEDGYRNVATIDIIPKTYTLTPGAGLTFVDTLTPSKLNHCEVKWWGKSASLHVLFVEDAPPEEATLTVTLEGTTSGAWSVDGGTTWKSSGESVTATEGTVYSVTFKAVDGYTTPDDQSVTLVVGANTLTATYTEEATTTAGVTVSGLGTAAYNGTYEATDLTTTYNGVSCTVYKNMTTSTDSTSYYLAHCTGDYYWGFSTSVSPVNPGSCAYYGMAYGTEGAITTASPTAAEFTSYSWSRMNGASPYTPTFTDL